MTGILSLPSKLSPFPYAALAISAYTNATEIVFTEDAKSAVLELNGRKIEALPEIVHTLAREGGLLGDSSETEKYFKLADELAAMTTVDDFNKALDILDDHLAYHTFLVGHTISSADWILKVVGLLKSQRHIHLLRWFNHLESLESTQSGLALLAAAKSTRARSSKTAAGFALGLEGAKEGEVVTRFPPEPSGYLHIGHAKAVILNHYFAKMYKGKLLIRFDDTNPSKEKTEFEETILEDLHLLNVVGDSVTHTSDYFQQIYDLAVKMIGTGRAYADDTDATTPVNTPCSCPPKSHGQLSRMAFERFHGIHSTRRNATVEENLTRFKEMAAGSEEGARWCLRAKISMENPNKAMRDPVIYRCNSIPHHRTGDKWKVYPTYDFACPIVDSLEGVTHALRTNEYRDRNAQYYWMIEALGLRPVRIWDFSRLNFIYTILSKRKLTQFVNSGIVSGWDDPRMPTVRGIRRRGLTVEALQQFMLQQGPSQAILSLEWDSLWNLNKKVIDPIAPRYWSVIKKGMVPVTIYGGPASPEVRTLPKHKKNPTVGEKSTVYTSSVLVEQADAASFGDQEEITLMDWGNAIVRSKVVDTSGAVTTLEMELHLDGDFRTTKKKVTWLAQPTDAHKLVDVRLLDYDYLITKKKIEEGDNWEDLVTPVSEFKEEALADANVLDVEKDEQKIIQFERKGFYSYDGKDTDGYLRFVKIPDGKAASTASKATPAQEGKSTKADKAPRVAKTPKAVEGAPDTPTDIKMYPVELVYAADVQTPVDLKMYKVDNIYDV
ncbi:glutamyl-tRNA synthetase [Fistulina hepatica ATCC 64428]|nr:glutamyl-tRNA synthetase [Fistulina hepatica ATCC 64428]